MLGGLDLSGKTSLLGGSSGGAGGLDLSAKTSLFSGSGGGGLFSGKTSLLGGSSSGSGGGGLDLGGITSLFGGLKGGGGDGADGGLIPGLPDPTQIIGGIRGFLETLVNVIRGVEGFKRTALNTGVGTVVSLQEVVNNPSLQETFDRGARAIGGIIQAAPELARAQQNLVRTAMCSVICPLVPEGETRYNCERVNCQSTSLSSSSDNFSDYGDYGDFS